MPAFLNIPAILTAAAMAALAAPVDAQIVPGGQGGLGRSSGISRPGEGIPSSPAASDKPDAAATKAYTAGLKSLAKAHDYESAAAAARNPDKKAAALEKMEDAYYRALDQFTEALSNKGDLYDAWNKVGYIHLRLGAYAESVDDYNHTLALQPDLPEAILHRAEAYIGVDRLDEAKAAYMDLFNHVRPLADELMSAMRKWLGDHRADARGMRASTVDAFGQWLEEREGIAKETASLPH